jgi:hypothetical protein
MSKHTQANESVGIDLLGVLPKALAATVLLLTMLNLVAIAFRFVLHHPQMMGFVPEFYFDLESNVPTWYSSAAWLIAGGLAAQAAALRRSAGRDGVRPWTAVAVLCAILSMDEVAGIHELPIDWLREQHGFHGPLYYGWVIPGAIFAGVVGMSLHRFWKFLPTPTRRLTLGAGITFLAGALGVEMLSGMQADAHGEENLGYALIITIEELLEMSGVVIFVYAMCGYLRTLQSGAIDEAVTERSPAVAFIATDLATRRG